MSLQLTFAPLSKSNWNSFVELFGKNGACGGCWCMFWLLPRKEYVENKGDGNRDAMFDLVNSGVKPGILAFDNGKPVGWCAVAPRDKYLRLANSRVLAPVDEKIVWSVVCFFVAKPYRNSGVGRQLLKAAKEFVRESGGTILEGYPSASEGKKSPDAFVYTGMESMFIGAGFSEVARRSPKRPVLRCVIKNN